ncbi:Actin cytoskeleton-regulatory complex PAN1 [Quillaja saponaria]|uniref:Actin cytoskeleton-regulatory complex PAN1 n=1 Tax=Quillaja saponaria TaxID=32244 RepID=A0AAD7M4W8_QUISA|nr:Actin cytoskeleton-regulatory complex PAN1 [Quillaja saponaria]KAJ7970041.1 Actin cytoskeleton-regulatory complex PAN1 [Quillaja saponaria]
MASKPSLLAEIGPDGLLREAPVIAYTEKIIEAEQLQLKKYIEENYSKIRDVEREFTNLTMEMKLTAGPKKAALEHLRKKVEASTERIRAAKLKEEQARKVWEAASKAVRDEEAIKQKLCEDLNNLVQESSNTQFSRLEELKRRLEALNPNRESSSLPRDAKLLIAADNNTTKDAASVPSTTESHVVTDVSKQGNGEKVPIMNGHNQENSVEGEEGRGKKKVHFQVKGKGIGAVVKSRSAAPGWTGAGFDVDGRT